MARNLRRSRDRNRTPVQAMVRAPAVRGFGDAPRGTDTLVLSKPNPDIATKPGLFGIDFGGIVDSVSDFFGDVNIDDFFGRGVAGGSADGGGGRPATGRDAVFGTGGGRGAGGGGGGGRPSPVPVGLDNFTGGFGDDFSVVDEVAEILGELGLGPVPGLDTVARPEGEAARFGGPVSGLFTDLDANQLEDSAGRPLVVNPGLEERIKCPRGYVAVEIDDEGTRVCMLKGAAISQGLYSRRPRPPISASEWRILKSAGRTGKKVEAVLGKAGASVGKKLVSKTARPRTPRARPAMGAREAQLLLNAGQPRSDDDTVIIT